MQAFDPLEEIKNCRSTFLAAVNYYIEVLRAANLLTNDLVRASHWRILLEILNEVRIRANTRDPPDAGNNKECSRHHDRNLVLTVKMSHLREQGG